MACLEKNRELKEMLTLYHSFDYFELKAFKTSNEMVEEYKTILVLGLSEGRTIVMTNNKMIETVPKTGNISLQLDLFSNNSKYDAAKITGHMDSTFNAVETTNSNVSEIVQTVEDQRLRID